MNNRKWLLQVCNKSVALDWTKILSYWLYTRSGMEHLKVKIRVKFTQSQKTSNCNGKVSNKIFENIRTQFITFMNSLPLILQHFIQCPRHRFRCDIFVVQPYPNTERYSSGQVVMLICKYGDPDKRYTTVNCLLGTQQPSMCDEKSHIRMR